MPNPQRYLQFTKVEMGYNLEAHCSVCDRKFVGTPQFGEHVDEALLRMREDFELHDCAQQTKSA